MPRISEFFGMTIYMYWFDIQKHHQPHFHVRYGGAEAVFTLEGRRLDGRIGGRAERLISEWCAERQAEIQHAWSCAAQGQEVPWILPLQ